MKKSEMIEKLIIDVERIRQCDPTTPDRTIAEVLLSHIEKYGMVPSGAYKELETEDIYIDGVLIPPKTKSFGWINTWDKEDE